MILQTITSKFPNRDSSERYESTEKKVATHVFPEEIGVDAQTGIRRLDELYHLLDAPLLRGDLAQAGHRGLGQAGRFGRRRRGGGLLFGGLALSRRGGL